jgi:TfoX/Sxy family transcriptional regulator of competence genes
VIASADASKANVPSAAFGMSPEPDRQRFASFNIQDMAYDETLAAQVRELVSDEPGLTERRMFGGLAFLVGGNMAVAASGQGGLLVRVAPDESHALLETTNAHPMVMRGKPMRGWLRVDSEHLRPRGEVERWVRVGVNYARSLPEKRSQPNDTAPVLQSDAGGAE